MPWTHSDETKRIHDEAGGYELIHRITERFYEKMAVDGHIKELLKSLGPKHAIRLAQWLSEKLSGDATWTSARPADSRTRSHVKAWNSPRRPEARQGRRFKLDDCRVWMRLLFWAAREEGVPEAQPEFFALFVRLVRHFIRVYEYSAPPYAEEDAAWSAEPRNIEAYLENGHMMGDDVIGIAHGDRWL